MLDEVGRWMHDKGDMLSAAAIGGIMAVAVGWKNPITAIRQMVCALGIGWTMGPAWNLVITTTTPFHGDAVLTSCVCAAGVTGLWIVEGLLFASRKWSEKPRLPSQWFNKEGDK